MLGPLLLLLLGELGARAIAPKLPEWKGFDGRSVILTGHPTRLWGLSPGERKNVTTTATINESGYRGKEATDPKTARRVLVLGDSSFFGHGVSDDQTLGAVLEQELDRVEVLNLGVPGYSSEQIRTQMEEVGWALEPDLLVLGSFWSDSNWDAFRDQDLLRSQGLARWNPLVWSALFRLTATTVASQWPGEGTRIVSWSERDGWPEEGVRRVPVRRYAENLDAMASRDVPVLFVTPCPRLEILEPDSPRDWAPYAEAQAAIAEHHGMPRLELCPILAGDVEALFMDEVHPTTAGHEIIGQALAQLLRDSWPEPSTAAPFEDYQDWDTWESKTPKEGSPMWNLFQQVETVEGWSEEPAWSLTGRVESSEGPVQVQVFHEGLPVAVHTMTQDGNFNLPVPEAYEEVRVTVSSPSGREELTVRPGDDLYVVLGD